MNWLGRMRRIRRPIAAVICAIGVALTIVIIAGSSSDDRSEERAAARRLATQAGALLRQDPRRAALAARASSELEPSIDADRAMLGVAIDHLGVRRVIKASAQPLAGATRTKRAVVTVGRDGRLRFWDPASGAMLAERKHPRPFVAAAGGGPTPVVATADQGGRIGLWNAIDPQRPAPSVLEEPEVSPGRLVLLGFSGRGSQLFALLRDGRIERWDSATGARLERVELRDARGRAPWRGRRISITHAQVSGNDYDGTTTLLVATSSRDVVRIDLKTMRAELVVPANELRGDVTGLGVQEFGPKVVAVGTSTGLVLLDDETRAVERHPGPPVTAVSLVDDTLTYSTSEGLVSVDTTEPWVDQASPNGREADGIFNGTEGTVATHPDGSVSDLLLSRTDSALGFDPLPSTSLAAFTPSGDLLTADGSDATDADGLVVLRSRKSGDVVSEPRRIQEFKADPSWWSDDEERGWYISEAVMNDELTVAGGQDPTGTASVLVWNAKTGKPVKRLPLTTGGVTPSEPAIVTSLALLPKRHMVAAYSTVQEAIVLWSSKDWQQVATIDVGPTGGFAVSPDETTIVAAALSDEQSDQNAGFPRSRLVSIDVGERRITRTTPTSSTHRVAIAPDADRLATLEDGGHLRVRSADGRRELRAIDLENEFPITLQWRPDSEVIAVGLADRGSVLVDPDSGRVSEPLPPPRGSDPVELSWSRDGKRLAASNLERDDSGRPSTAPPSVWELDSERLERRMCEIAATGPTVAEWKRWVGPAIPHRELCATAQPRRTPGAGGVAEPVVVYQRGEGIYVAGADGHGKQVGTTMRDARVSFDWSPRGALTWASDNELHLVEPGGRQTTLPCPCTSSVFDGETAVAVNQEGSSLLRVEPGDTRPAGPALRGLFVKQPSVIETARGHAIVNGFVDEPTRATPSLLHAIDRHGGIRQLVKARGPIYDRAVTNPSGERVAFVSVLSGGACYSQSQIEILDVERKHVTRPAMPHRPDQVVRSLSWSPDGTLQAAIAPVGCVNNEYPDALPDAELYELRGDRLVGTGRQMYDIQPGMPRVTGILRGPVGTDLTGTLVLERSGRGEVRVADRVRSFLVRR